MIDLQDNDATHGDEAYKEDFTTEAFIEAKEQIFNRLGHIFSTGYSNCRHGCH